MEGKSLGDRTRRETIGVVTPNGEHHHTGNNEHQNDDCRNEKRLARNATSSLRLVVHWVLCCWLNCGAAVLAEPCVFGNPLTATGAKHGDLPIVSPDGST